MSDIDNIDRKMLFKDIEKIVLKIGTSSLTKDDGSFDRRRTEEIAKQVSLLKKVGKNILIVSSGAIGLGCEELKIPRPKDIPLRQAAAAVGQNILMREWMDSFKKYNINVAQILLTYNSLLDSTTCENLRDSITELMKLEVIPIINENDPICVKEIGTAFGDNDNLSAILALRIGAEVLIILSDIDGLYNKNPKSNEDAQLISIVEKITSDIESCADGNFNGIGGMKTKIDAAKIVTKNRCNMVIANSAIENVVLRILDGEGIGTIFISEYHGKSGNKIKEKIVERFNS